MTTVVLNSVANHLWQSTLFTAVAALLVLALRRNQARVRCWLWLAASYKFLVPFSLLVGIGGLFQWRSAPAVIPHAVTTVTDFVSDPIFLTTVSAVRPTHDYATWIVFAAWIVWVCGFVVVLARWMREWLRIRAIVRAASPLRISVTTRCHSPGSAVVHPEQPYREWPDEESILGSAVANAEERFFRRLLRPQNDTRDDSTVRIVTTRERIEPGVFGIFHPVLLLPEGIADRLTAEQLQAVIAHELCHVRRRDNLTATIHMLAEAVFWFYPVVWWLGTRIIDERERACDEEVLRTGGQAQAYAESILRVCEFYLESPLTCVSGISGSNLKKRIRRIMSEHFGAALSRRKQLLLAAVAITAVAGPFGIGAFRLQSNQRPSTPDWQSNAGGKMAFEVASVKQDAAAVSAQTMHSNVPLGPGDYYSPTGGLFSATNIPLFTYITFAFKATSAEIPILQAEAPKWVSSERFDIEARAAGDPTKDQMRLMMQSLLEDRFKLAIHTATRQLPVFAAVLVKSGRTGPQLQAHPSDAPCGSVPSSGPSSAPGLLSTVRGGFPVMCGGIQGLHPSAPGRIRIGARNVPMRVIAGSLGITQLTGVDRPVLDGTGLRGMFDFVIEFAPQTGGICSGDCGSSARPPVETVQPDLGGPTLLEALREQLGLKLVSTKGPVDVLVIDHVEQPTPI